jgi:hypothetical protein
MARFIGVATIAEQALAAATPETVLQLVAAANHRVTLLRWGVFFDGVSGSAEPVQVRLVRQTSEGSSSANTPAKMDDSIAETLLTTARDTFTVEASDGDVLDLAEVHPQSSYEVIFPLGQEPIIGGGDRLGIECTAPAIVNVRAKMVFEE